jgi:hypothetical protein
MVPAQKQRDIEPLIQKLRAIAKAKKLGGKPNVISGSDCFVLDWGGYHLACKTPDWDREDFDRLIARLKRW